MSNLRALWLTLVVAACGGDDTISPPPPPPPSGNPPLTATVSLVAGNAFSPAAVTIARTGTVTWSNDAGVTHNVTFAQVTGAPNNVPNFSTGSAARTFATAGTFAYTCTLHAGMAGQVTVQ
jgi:plastocyanin